MIPEASVWLKHKILIVDDHPLVREGMTLLLDREPDLSVCAVAEDAASALAALAEHRPHLAIIDISLPGRDGLDLLKAIRAKEPHLPVLVYSMHGEATYAERALRAGANGYVMKLETTGKLLAAIRRVLKGEICVSEQTANRVLCHFAGAPGAGRASGPVDSLSDRELEVFRRMGEGQSTREIAQELHLSVKTVETHQARMKEKLAVHTSRELVQCAIEHALSEEGSLPAAGREISDSQNHAESDGAAIDPLA